MNADVLHAALALLVLVAIAWVPGLALCRVLSPRQSRLTAVAAAPAVGAGILYVCGEVLTLFDVPVDGRLALVAFLVSTPLLWWYERRQLARWSARSVPAAVVVGSATAAAIWGLGIRHLTAVPPHNDGFNHGLFVARVARLRTLDPTTVIPHDVLSGGRGMMYYPLALHQQAAILVRALHLDVGLAWTLTSLSLTVLALPLGMYCVGRQLFPLHARAVSATAIVSALMPGVTYSTSWWGGFAIAAGLAATPGAFLCIVEAATGARDPRRIALAGVALAGIAGIHTSEFSFLAVLAGVYLLTAPALARNALGARRVLLRVAACFAVAGLLIAPVWGQLHRGLNERAYPLPDFGLSVAKAAGEVLVSYSFVPPATPAAIVIAVWLGLLLARRQEGALGWLFAWITFAVLFVWLAAFPGPLIGHLTSTWYSDRFRLGYLLAFLAIPLVGLAVAGPEPGRDSLRRRGRAATSIALALVLALTSFVDSVTGIRRNYEHFSLAGPDARAAFAFLARTVPPGERVLNQHQDGSPWMYALAGVAPTVAGKNFDYEGPEWADVNYLLRHIANAGTDSRVDQLLHQLNVEYVYIGAKTIPTEVPDLDRTALARSPALRVVFERHGTRVYRVVTSGAGQPR